VNWTQRSTIYATDVKYGNGIFVAVSTVSAYASTDGITWVQGTVPSEWTQDSMLYLVDMSLTFGNGVFIVTSSWRSSWSNRKADFFTSVDGINWVYQSAATRNPGYGADAIAYSPTLGFFLNVGETPRLTLEGHYFVQSKAFFKETPQDLAWSNELNALVVVCLKYFGPSPAYIYTSFDEGQTWTEIDVPVSTSNNFYTPSTFVCWSSDLGKFFVYVLITESITIYSSKNGVDWDSSQISPLYQFSNPVCSKKM
jgi:hypothetical protein